MPIGLALLILGGLYFADKHGKLKYAVYAAAMFLMLYGLAHCQETPSAKPPNYNSGVANFILLVVYVRRVLKCESRKRAVVYSFVALAVWFALGAILQAVVAQPHGDIAGIFGETFLVAMLGGALFAPKRKAATP